MRSLLGRVKRLEDRAKQRNTRAPSVYEFLDASARQQARNLASAYGKLDPDLPGRVLSEQERETLENDIPEQRARDEDIMRRSEGVYGSDEAETAAHANRCLARLRSLERIGDRGGPS